jgi:ribonuclease P protein component
VNSKHINSGVFSLRFIIDPSINEPRFGVSVSKKISKSAVVRNTIRRQTYTSLKPYIRDFPHGLFLFVAKTGIEKLKSEKLREEIKKILKTAPFVLEGKKS